MAGAIERPWSDEQLKSDDLGKREMITFLQSHSSKEVRMIDTIQGKSTFNNIIFCSVFDKAQVTGQRKKCDENLQEGCLDCGIQ